MEPADLREAFAAFLGAERFRKFVAAGAPWRFWQEREWRRFCAARPEFATRREALEVALRVCEVHGDALRPDDVERFHGCVDYTSEYVEACRRLFPHAARGPVSTEGTTGRGDRIGVWYCPACRVAEEKWNARRRSRPPG